MSRSVTLAALVALFVLTFTAGPPSALADTAEASDTASTAVAVTVAEVADTEPALAFEPEASSTPAVADLGLLDEAVTVGSSCSVSLNCGDGNVVSCTGTTSCSRTIAGVICDGNEVRCPNFCSLSLNCGPCGIATCWSTAGNCTRNPDACDGRLLRCRCPR